MDNRKFGWRPDPPDHRDYAYTPAPTTLPPKVDPFGFVSRIEDQGQTSACTAHGVTSTAEIVLGVSDLSRLFQWYNSRALEHTTALDTGVTIRDAIKAFSTYGCPPEPNWPWVPSLYARRPLKAAYSAAKPLAGRVTRYERATSLDGVRAALARGVPVVFGFMVPASVEETATTGWLKLPQPGERSLGGHCVVAVGYDDAGQFLWFRNSWGADWGVKPDGAPTGGYARMPYAYVTDPRRLADDFWTLHA